MDTIFSDFALPISTRVNINTPLGKLSGNIKNSCFKSKKVCINLYEKNTKIDLMDNFTMNIIWFCHFLLLLNFTTWYTLFWTWNSCFWYFHPISPMGYLCLPYIFPMKLEQKSDKNLAGFLRLSDLYMMLLYNNLFTYFRHFQLIIPICL